MSTKRRYCWVCGRELSEIDRKYGDGDCGEPECEKAAYEAEQAEYEERQFELAREYGREWW